MNYKEYREEHKDYISMVAREKYATNLEYQESIKAAAMKRYEAIQASKERKQLYNEERRDYMREYMREYRKRKKNQ